MGACAVAHRRPHQASGSAHPGRCGRRLVGDTAPRTSPSRRAASAFRTRAGPKAARDHGS